MCLEVKDSGWQLPGRWSKNHPYISLMIVSRHWILKQIPHLRRELKDKTGESTVLIVTQRVATVKNADQIIVLDKGRVVGKGTHHELNENL